MASRVATLPQAVDLSLQSGIHPNSIFVFCRALKAFEITTRTRLSPRELENAFALWWNTAKPLITGGEDFDEYRWEFLRTFEKTRTPLGSNPLEEAIRLADSSPLPPEAGRYPSPKIKRLVAVCFHLQAMSGDAPFFLGARDAAAVIGTKKPETGSTFLTGLVKDGVLTVIQKGQPGGNRATRFRYRRQ